MTDEEKKLLDEIRRGRVTDRFICLGTAIVMATFMVTMWDRHHPTLNKNTVAPEIITNVGSERADINSRAEGRGYYTREEFAKLSGKGYRTIQRYEEQGRLSPAPARSNSGQVQIDLDTKILPESGQ